MVSFKALVFVASIAPVLGGQCKPATASLVSTSSSSSSTTQTEANSSTAADVISTTDLTETSSSVTTDVSPTTTLTDTTASIGTDGSSSTTPDDASSTSALTETTTSITTDTTSPAALPDTTPATTDSATSATASLTISCTYNPAKETSLTCRRRGDNDGSDISYMKTYDNMDLNTCATTCYNTPGCTILNMPIGSESCGLVGGDFNSLSLIESAPVYWYNLDCFDCSPIGSSVSGPTSSVP